MVEILLMGLAGIGILMMFIGRHIMIRDTGGDVPMGWIVVLRIVPFSELVYMVRHYGQARTGGIVSIVGMWLIVPYFGMQMYARDAQVEKWRSEIEQHQQKNRAEEISLDDANEMSAESISYLVRAWDSQLAAKTKKVAQINARLKTWFDDLQQKRSALTADAAAVQQFNADAAAYSGFNAVAKEENAELVALQEKIRRARK